MRRFALVAACCAATAVGCADQSATGPSRTIPAFSTVESSGAGWVVFHEETFTSRGGSPRPVSSKRLDLGSRVETVRVFVRSGTPSGRNAAENITVRVNGELLLDGVQLAGGGSTVVEARVDATHLQVETTVTGLSGALAYVRLERPGALVGPDGGVLELHGGDVSVIVPAGATDGIALTADRAPAEALEATDALGAFDFGPDGTRFNLPITISLPLPGTLPAGTGPEDVRLAWLDDDGLWQLLDNGRVQDGRVIGDIDHFTVIGAVSATVRVCPSDPRAEPDLARAIKRIAPGGTILLCDGAHLVSGVVIDKALQLTAEPGATPFVQGNGSAPALRIAHSRGTVSIRGLRFNGHGGHTITALSNYGDVLLEDLVFTGVATSAVYAGRGLAGTRVTVRRITATGGAAGVFAPNAQDVHVLDSHFSQQGASNIQLQGDASGVIRGNTVEECGSGGCIRVPSATHVVIEDNTLRSSARGGNLQSAILFRGASARIERNTIEGTGSVADRSNRDSYVFRQAGISIEGVAGGTAATLTSNTIRNAADGIRAQAVVDAPVAVTGSDNIATLTHTAVASVAGGTFNMQRNDFTDFLRAIHVAAVPEGETPIADGALRCNWWGSVDGAAGSVDETVPQGAWTPAATEPIAGRPGVTCDGGTAQPPATYSVVRVCTTGNGPVPTFATLAEAFAAVADDGTIRFCDGRHTVPPTTITRPVTLEPEQGASVTLVGNGERQIIVAEAFATGTVTIRGLSFENYGTYAVGSSHYANLVVEDAAFSALPTAWASVYVLGSPHAGASATVRRIRTTGGQRGLLVGGEAPDMHVLDSEFTNHAVANIQFQNTSSGVIRNNLVTECGVRACIWLPGGGTVVVEDNRIATTKRYATTNGITADGPDIRIERNTVEGLAAVTDPWNRDQYAMMDGILAIGPGNRDVSVVIVDNTISNVATGIGSFSITPGAQLVRATGRDNRISRVETAFGANNGGSIVMHRNDVDGYNNAVWIGVVEGRTTGDVVSVTCNWWGSTSVPHVNGAAPWGVYMPIATEPIAGRPGVSCDTSPAPQPTLARVCADGSFSSTAPTFTGLDRALNAVAPGGTVQLCAGGHHAQWAQVRKPVTIESEGTARAELHNGGTGANLAIGNTGAGTVTVRRVAFTSARWENVRVDGTYDAIVFDDVDFRPPTDPSPIFDANHNVYRGYSSGLGLGDASGGLVTVRNSRFIGGNIGVNSWNFDGDVLIENNTFSGNDNAAVHLGGGIRGVVRNNQVNGCGPSWCMGLFEAARVDIIGNNLDVDFASPTRHAILAWRTRSRIEANTITGVGGTSIPWQEATWPIREAISGTETDFLQVSDNRITNAYHGIMTWEAEATATGNIITGTTLAVGSNTASGRRFMLNWNDITDYAQPFHGSSFWSVPGSATCNWWGSAAGPSNVPSEAPPNVYSPWAMSPIAQANPRHCD
jgi:hypothetical protein